MTHQLLLSIAEFNKYEKAVYNILRPAPVLPLRSRIVHISIDAFTVLHSEST